MGVIFKILTFGRQNYAEIRPVLGGAMKDIYGGGEVSSLTRGLETRLSTKHKMHNANNAHNA